MQFEVSADFWLKFMLIQLNSAMKCYETPNSATKNHKIDENLWRKPKN